MSAMAESLVHSYLYPSNWRERLVGYFFLNYEMILGGVWLTGFFATLVLIVAVGNDSCMVPSDLSTEELLNGKI